MSQFLCFVYMSYSSCYYLLVLYTCLTPAVFGIRFQNHEGLVKHKSTDHIRDLTKMITKL